MSREKEGQQRASLSMSLLLIPTLLKLKVHTIHNSSISTLMVVTWLSLICHSIAGSDYKAVSTSLTFTPDDERKCFQIQVTVDQQDEEKEEFMAVITAAPQNILVNNQTRVTIISIRDSRGESDQKSLSKYYPIFNNLLPFSEQVHSW